MRKNYLEIKDVDFKIGGKTKVKSASFQLKMKVKLYVY
jgi:hypothetical protein